MRYRYLWLVCALLAGCSWGHEDRLGYMARAQETIAAAVKQHAQDAEELVEKVAPLVPDVPEPPARMVLRAKLGQIRTLANEGVKRAKIVQLYHNAPQDLEIELGKGRDNFEVVAAAGLASMRHAKRKAPGKLAGKLAGAVAEIASQVVIETTRTVWRHFIPVEVWVGLGILAAVAVGLGSYSWYQKRSKKRREAELKHQLYLRGLGLDEYDEFGEDWVKRFPRELEVFLEARSDSGWTLDDLKVFIKRMRYELGKGRLHLASAHGEREERRRARAKGNPIPEDRPLNDTRPSAEELLPLNGKTPPSPTTG